MLEVRSLITGYGDAQALFGVDLDIASGEVVTLLGRNGIASDQGTHFKHHTSPSPK